MAEKHLCATKFHPLDADRMSTGSVLKTQLEAGRQVTVDSNGWILDVWDPVTKKTYDDQGNEIGTREKTFVLPEASEIRVTSFTTYTIADLDQFDPEGDIWNLLKNNRQVTLDADKNIVDIWNEAGNDIEDAEGNIIGARHEPYTEYYEKHIRNPFTHTTYPEDSGDIKPDHWFQYFLNLGYQISIDSNYDVVDIWDPKTGNVYDSNDNIVSTRKDPYASEQNIADTKLQYETLLREIALLRTQARRERGAVKSNTQQRIASKLSEYGRLVWLYGRLIGRRRRSNKQDEIKQSKSEGKPKVND